MRFSGLPVVVMALTFACGPLRSEQAVPQPVDLVRSLRVLQDRVAFGDRSAHQGQRALLAQIAAQLAQVDGEAWKDARNARAVVTFVLSGGDPRILKRLLDSPLLGVDQGLAQGVLAYGEGRSAEAARLLDATDARTLDSEMAGQVALVQSELVAKSDPQKAMALLDDARLLSPGTLIEEAALRRQVAVVAAAGDFDRFQTLSTRYLNRFPNSLYAGNFRSQFASLVVNGALGSDAARLHHLESELAAIDPADRLDIYLAIAREGLIKGKLEIARFAGRNAAQLTDKDTVDGARARLYEAAAASIASGSDTDLVAARSKVAFAEDDAELLAAALSVVDEVRRLPREAAAATKAQLDDLAANVTVVARAQKAVEHADQILREAGK